MSGFFDFLLALFSKDNSEKSVVIKNIITGNNNQKNKCASKHKTSTSNKQRTSSNPTNIRK